MRFRWLIIGLVLVFSARRVLVAAGAAIECPQREEVLLMDSWRFKQAPLQLPESPACDDSTWDSISIPHCWNPDAKVGGYIGDGWYRRKFRIPPAWAGRRIFLQFDGANRSAEVFIDGRRIGAHEGGFARFRFDVTALVSGNADQLLAVRVNNSNNDNRIPVSADYTFFGGIYRAVSLFAVSPLHIEVLDHASPGVWVIQKTVSPELAELNLHVKLANDGAQAEEALVRGTMLDGKGTVVARVEERLSLPSLGRRDVSRRIELPRPNLWKAKADPYLYRMNVEVLSGAKVVDSISIPVGVRSFAVDRTNGFLLNGHYLDLHGASRHQDHGAKGWAIGEAEEETDFGFFEEIGATMVRQSHYQQSQHWSSMGDERGLIMWAELAFVNEARDNRAFMENAKEQLRELIRQNHHHPAICFWSIGNETFVRDAKLMPADTSDRMLRELAIVAREEDPTRLTAYASNGSVNEPRAGVADVLAFNHYYGWYHDEPEDFAAWLDRQRAMRPDLCIGMSEYGAGANTSHHEQPAKRPVTTGQWHPEEWQSHYHEVHWATFTDRPWIWCKLVWNMFDFSSAWRNEGGIPGVNDKGLVTMDRKIRKDAFYFYKANWNDEPTLHITSKRFTPRRSPTTDIKVYSNAPAVELIVNGGTVGTVRSANHVFTWTGVVLAPGSNRIEAHATVDTKTLSDSCEWVYEAKGP
jgi:beta-galactosidase